MVKKKVNKHLQNIHMSVKTAIMDTIGYVRQKDDDDYVVLHHTLPIFMGLGQCPIVSWDFAGAVSIFGPDILPVIHQ